MILFTDYLWFNTKRRQEFVRITDEVAAIVNAEFDGQRRKRVIVKVMGEA